MRTIRLVLLALSVVGALSGFTTLWCEAATYQSNGSASSVQALHRVAHDGDTIRIPAGKFTWSTPIIISKAIKLKGQGGGRIIGDTKSRVTIGTGSTTFATTRVIPGIVAGQTLHVAKMPALNQPSRDHYMEGTVISYSGTNLVLNVTKIGGSGTYRFWWIATKPATTIVNNCPSGAAISVNQPNTGSVEISGIQAINPSPSDTLSINATTYSGPKTLVHDCWFQSASASSALMVLTNRGLVWNCSFDDTFSQVALAFHMKMETDAMEPSWSTNSTWGADDINGATNFYIEDCDFHAYLNAADFDSNTRVVFRHNVLDNSGLGSHGAGTSPIGVRHVELYNNELIFDNFGDCDGSLTLNVNWFFWQRGGSAVITDNILPAISSCAWANKPNITFSILNLGRSTGCYPCWKSYPAPHQIGQGFGPGAVRHSAPCNQTNYGYYYVYSEPDYIWNNTGGGGNKTSLTEETSQCGTNQHLSEYVQAERDYILGPKPGYVKYAYPHPARSFSYQPSPTPSATPNSVQEHREKKKTIEDE
jgi:hypothetical protein